MQKGNLGQPVVVDSNVIVKELQEGRSLAPIAKRIKKHKSKMIVPESVLGEVSKITGKRSDSIMAKIYQFCKYPVTFDKTEEIESESNKLIEKYHDCNYPDSLILATAKLTGSALVSFDKELLQSAKYEGVQAFLPRNFIRWW